MKKFIKSALIVSLICSVSQFAVADAGSQPVKLYSDSQSVEVNNDAVPAGDNTDAKPMKRAADYTINAGDVLQITVWKEPTLDREVLVLPDGTITFPLIGSFNAEGQTPAEVQAIVKAKLRSLIPSASVTVMVKAALGHEVSVIGQVNKPGEIVMGHRLTVMEALSQAGGLTPYASESSIIILRREGNKETAIRFPYSDITAGKHLDKDILLVPEDVVVVPTAGLL